MAAPGLRPTLQSGLWLLLALLFLAGCQVPAAAPLAPTSPPVPPAPKARTGDPELIRDVAWLTAPEQEGRGLGSEGLARAAKGLAKRFEHAGLQPGGSSDFLQEFETSVHLEIGESSLRSGTEGWELEPEQDFLPLMISESGSFEGELVFAGYGIRSPDDGHDDYSDFDVRDKLVILLEGRPEKGALGGVAGLPFLQRRSKIATARELGARAVIFVSDQDLDEQGLRARVHATDPKTQPVGIFALRLSSRAARLLMDSHGPRLDLLREKARVGARAQATLGVRVQGSIEILRSRGSVANVIGFLPGADPAVGDEAVVIGAHYDHLGLGVFGSLTPERRGQVHAGADDNASGTAALLWIARSLAEAGPLRRTVVFVAFTAEEAGLLGSSHFVKNSPEALPATIAMLNMDMVGRLRDRRLVIFGSESATEWKPSLEAAAGELGLRLAYEGTGPGPSDQTSFYVKSIPVLHFFTGTHSGYHTPDDRPELLNYEGLEQVAGVVLRVARDFADAPGAPRFVGEPASGHGSIGAGAGPGYGPDLGTIPAFGGEPVIGVRISGVRPGSPAERAGLQGGDVIVSFAGTQLRDLAEFAALLFAERAGNEVAIRVLRSGEPMEFQAILGNRR